VWQEGSSGDFAFTWPSLCAVLPLGEEVEEGCQALDHPARLLTTDGPAISATEERDAFVDERLSLRVTLWRGGRL